MASTFYVHSAKGLGGQMFVIWILTVVPRGDP